MPTDGDRALHLLRSTYYRDPGIAVIDVPVLRLDHRLDRQRLLETVERTRFSPRHKRVSQPVLLDPLPRQSPATAS